jgi:hypothetical protein
MPPDSGGIALVFLICCFVVCSPFDTGPERSRRISALEVWAGDAFIARWTFNEDERYLDAATAL